eukprot:12889629-Prorocentrum_lima.AAC.1
MKANSTPMDVHDGGPEGLPVRSRADGSTERASPYQFNSCMDMNIKLHMILLTSKKKHNLTALKAQCEAREADLVF